MANNLRKHRERGYILPEALLAVMILMMALVPLGGMYLGALKNAGASLNRTTAVFLAQAKMEELKAAWDLNGSLADEPASDFKELNGAIYRREFVSQEHILNSLDLVQVTVTVAWDSRGESRDVSLATYFNK